MIPPISFHQQEFTVLDDLVNSMGMNWLEGRQLLFSGKLREHTRKVDSSFANSCASAEKESQLKANEANRIFLKWLCKYPGIKGLYWQGYNYGGIKRISSTLAARDETLQKLLLHMLKAQFLNSFLKNLGGSDALVDNVRFLEKAYTMLPCVTFLAIRMLFFEHTLYPADAMPIKVGLENLSNHPSLFPVYSQDAIFLFCIAIAWPPVQF